MNGLSLKKEIKGFVRSRLILSAAGIVTALSVVDLIDGGDVINNICIITAMALTSWNVVRKSN